MADDSRAVRILSDLCGVLRREKNIREFGFVYCPEPLYNKSPIVVVDGNLGIETWSIKLLYFHAYSQLFHNKQWQCDLKRVSDCSMAVVLLNPECLSAWNLRKQLVLNKYLRAEEELNFARLVLSKHPKSPETFSQRRWLLQQLFPTARARKDSLPENACQDGDQAVLDPNPAGRLQDDMGRDPDDENVARRLHGENERLMTFVGAEMEVCTLAAGRYPSNYNAWSHRIWVVEHVAGNPPQFLKSELEATKSWVSVHVSDHSGFHYRQFLLGTLMGLARLTHPRPGSSAQRGRLVSDAGLPGGLVLEELQLILELVMSYPGHEAVWYHRRFVVYLWKSLLCNGTATESDQIIGNQETTSSTGPSSVQMPSVDTGAVEDRPIANQLVGKRPSENQQIGNQPLGKRPIENQPVGNQPLGRPPSENRATENGHREEVAHLAEIDTGCSAGASSAGGGDSQTGQAGKDEDVLKRGTPLSPMQLPSRCSHDASLLHLSDQHTSPRSPPPQNSLWGKATSQASGAVSCVADDAFSANEILRLVQHEKRFVDIVVEGATSAEKAAQQKCAENYCRWLENLQVFVR